MPSQMYSRYDIFVSNSDAVLDLGSQVTRNQNCILRYYGTCSNAVDNAANAKQRRNVNDHIFMLIPIM